MGGRGGEKPRTHQLRWRSHARTRRPVDFVGWRVFQHLDRFPLRGHFVPRRVQDFFCCRLDTHAIVCSTVCGTSVAGWLGGGVGVRVHLNKMVQQTPRRRAQSGKVERAGWGAWRSVYMLCTYNIIQIIRSDLVAAVVTAATLSAGLGWAGAKFRT